MMRLTRRQLASFSIGCALGARRALTQTVSYRDYSRCLPDFLNDLAEKAYAARNRQIAGLSSPASIAARQRWVRETFWKLVGGMPERTPLRARTTGSLDRPGYRLEKVLYESRPEFHIPANLYVPSGARPPFPGVLFQMGHSLNGKASDTYQKCCQGLARLGYLVLAFDPMGQGERTYYPNQQGYLTRLRSADDEHTTPGRQMLLVGDTATRLQVWDAVRSLDYLASHPQVDPKRLASAGQSGGGTLTMLLAAVDDRLAAAAVSCGNTENLACANFNAPGSTDDAEQNLLGSGPLGFDRWDLLYPMAPKPLLLIVSAKDFFGTYSPRYISNGREEFGKLRQVYATLGHAERIEWAETPLPHNLSYDRRLKIYNWFERWLKGRDKVIEREPEVAIEPDKNIWVSSTGNVVRDFHGETPFSMAKRTIRHDGNPKDPGPLLGVDRPEADLRATSLGRSPYGAIDVEAIEVHSGPKVWTPAWLFLPGKAYPAKPLLVVLEPQGRNSKWHEDELYPKLASEGCVVCSADVRGTGDLSPEFGRGSPGYTRFHESEENFAWASLMLGKPLLGQRVTDVLALVSGLRRHPAAAGRRMVIAASGKMTVPALFACALDPEIHSLYLAGGVVSYRNIMETENYSYPLANFIPGILNQTDLPGVAAAIGPRRVYLAGSVDGTGKRMDAAAVRVIYEKAKNVEVTAEAEWNLQRLLQL